MVRLVSGDEAPLSYSPPPARSLRLTANRHHRLSAGSPSAITCWRRADLRGSLHNFHVRLLNRLKPIATIAALPRDWRPSLSSPRAMDLLRRKCDGKQTHQVPDVPSESKLSYRSEQISEEQYRLRALHALMSDENVVDRGRDNYSEQGKWDFHGDASGPSGSSPRALIPTLAAVTARRARATTCASIAPMPRCLTTNPSKPRGARTP